MKTKIAASIVVVAGLSLTGCGFVSTDSSENTETVTEETVVETNEEASENNEQASAADVDLSETLQDDGRIIFAPTFSKTETGGVSTILLEDTATVEQVEILRTRMKGIATMQENGLAQDPVQVYGADIPGISYLSENRDKYETIYTELPLGGSIEYKSNDPGVIEAIHEWIDYSLRTYRIEDTERPVEGQNIEPDTTGDNMDETSLTPSTEETTDTAPNGTVDPETGDIVNP